MRRDQLAHLVRAAGAILGLDEVLVIGSQAVLGTYPEDRLPAATTMSLEADLLTRDGDPARADLIDGTIGELSPFHAAFGVYAQGVDRSTARVPSGWDERLVRFQREDTGGVTAWCLEVHDLWVAKQLAGRPQDRSFCAALVAAALVDPRVLRERIETVEATDAERTTLRALIRRS